MSDPSLPAADTEHVKVAFRLVRDEDGFPPADWEHLWATVADEGLYSIDNTPFFVYGISVGDVVKAELQSGYLVYHATVKQSQHSTLRVMLFEEDEVEQVRKTLAGWGCTTELSHLPGLVAVDVPPEASLPAIRSFLDEGEKAGKWEYEEAALR
jgi:hypothetical protein